MHIYIGSHFLVIFLCKVWPYIQIVRSDLNLTFGEWKERIFSTDNSHVGIFFHWPFTCGNFFPQTIHRWTFFSDVSFTGGHFTDHSQVGIFFHGSGKTEHFFSLYWSDRSVDIFQLVRFAACVSSYCDGLPTNQHRSMFSFFTQNYLIKTLIDPIKLEHYPSMRRHFLIEPFRKPIYIKAGMRPRRWSSMRCKVFVKFRKVFECLGLIHFLLYLLAIWLLGIPSFQKYVFLELMGLCFLLA